MSDATVEPPPPSAPAPLPTRAVLDAAGNRLRGRRLAVRIVGGIGLAAVALYIPQYYGQTTTKLFAEAIYLAVAAMGLNLLTGYNGQVSIGHGAFFGLGAYTSGILMAHHGWNFYETLPVVAVLAFLVGAAVGFPALRIKGLYLALVTLGLASLAPLVITKYVMGSGGTALIQPTPVVTPGAIPPSIIPLGADDMWRYYVALLVAFVLFLAASNLVRSRIGRAMIAIRDREVAAESVGIDVARVKVVTFALSAAYAGVAGALAVLIDGVAQNGQLIFFQLSIEFLVAVVVGGAATVAGPIIGALLVTFLQDRTNHLSSNQVLSPAIFGGILIGLMYVAPDGIMGGGRRLWARFRRRSPNAPGAATPRAAPPAAAPPTVEPHIP